MIACGSEHRHVQPAFTVAEVVGWPDNQWSGSALQVSWTLPDGTSAGTITIVPSDPAAFWSALQAECERQTRRLTA